MVTVGTNIDAIVINISFHLILQGVRRNHGYFPFQPAVNGVVIGRHFHQRLLARMDKRHIARRNFRLNHHLIVKRNQTHQLAVRRDDAAHGRDVNILYDPANRRIEGQSGQGVFPTLHHRTLGFNLRIGFRQLFTGADVILVFHLGDFILKLIFLTLKTQHLHLAGRPLGHQRTGQRQLALHQLGTLT